MNPDHDAIERAERAMWRDLWESAPSSLAKDHGFEVADFGPIQVTTIADIPDEQWLNLVLGAGVAEDGHLGAALEWAAAQGVNHYVPLDPAAPGAEAATRVLRAVGYETGYGWMKFARSPGEPVRPDPPGVEVVELTDGPDMEAGQILATGFGLPEWFGEVIGGLVGRPRWQCYVAMVDGQRAGFAAKFTDGDIVDAGMAATLPEFRRRGCQSALLDRRIRDSSGARQLSIATGERLPDKVSNSYRNILAAGFEEVFVRPNWQPVRAMNPPR